MVDSGANVHMVNKRDLNSAELGTMKTVMTANGEVQTGEEATVHVKELDFLVKGMLFENTPAVLSLGKICEEFGYSDHWCTTRRTWFVHEFLIFTHFSSQETVTDTEVPATRREKGSDDSSTERNSRQNPTDIENQKNDDEELQMKMFQNIKMLQVLLTKYFGSREHTWHRVKRDSFIHFPKTRIATSA